MKKEKEPFFEKETDLCALFISRLEKEWTAYPETGGFDILLVRKKDGFQIGVEAKLKLNAKVVLQAAENPEHYYVNNSGPDCRAVLVPAYSSNDLAGICRLLGITVIYVDHPGRQFSYGIRTPYRPSLPKYSSPYNESDWYEICPAKRMNVPDWIPDVAAGSSSPMQLSFWKISAIKISVIMEKIGFVTRTDFSLYQISMSRWTQGKWIIKGSDGQWIKGPRFPDLRLAHPTNYGQIEADYLKWKREPIVKVKT